MRWRACLVILVVAGLASCSDDGDRGHLDVGSVTATFQEPTAVDGSVYTVSGHGTVLVRDATSEQMCAHRADGQRVRCFGGVVRIDPTGTGIVFSGDDQHIAMSDRARTNRVGGSAVTVLDMDTGAVRVLDPAAHSESAPALDGLAQWVDDDTVEMLRIPSNGDVVQIVRTRADLDDAAPEVHDIDGLTAPEAFGSSTVIDGHYVLGVVRRGEDKAVIVRVDPDGSIHELGTSTTPDVVAGRPSKDRGVFDAGLRSSNEIGILTVDGDDVASFTARTVSSAVSPDGRVIAALGSADDQVQIELFSFDGKDHQTLVAGEGVKLIEARNVVWTGDRQLTVWTDDGVQVIDLRND